MGLTTIQRAAVVLFTKPPVPGCVKTRLIGELNAKQASELHAAFLSDVVTTLAGQEFSLEIALALPDDDCEKVALHDQGTLRRLLAGSAPTADRENHPAIRLALPDNAYFSQQQGADLGERLFFGLQAALGRGYTAVAAVGSDHPEIEASEIRDAFHRLGAGADVVLGPAGDGGYYLIAARQDSLRPVLFSGIEWSSPAVLEQTLGACLQEGLACELLREAHDIDTAADLALLVERLVETADGCAATRELLASWGRL